MDRSSPPFDGVALRSSTVLISLSTIGGCSCEPFARERTPARTSLRRPQGRRIAKWVFLNRA